MIDVRKKKYIEKVIKDENLDVSQFVVEYIFERVEQYLSENPSERKNGHSIFRNFVRYLLQRNIANYDAMILISGQKGTGKSSAGISFAKFWCWLLDIRFDLNKSIVYSNAQVMKAVDELSMFSPVVCDEAIDFASAQNWNKAENKQLKIKLGKIRTKHLFFILCWPWKINKLDKIYLDSYVNYWIDLYDRGKGAIFIKDMNPVEESWRLDYFKKIGTFNEFTPKYRIKKVYSKHPNFWDLITIPKPSQDVWDKYCAIRQKNVFNSNDLKGSITSIDKAYAFIVQAFADIYMKTGTAKFKRLAKHFKERYNVSVSTADMEEVFKQSRSLVEKTVEDENSKSAKV